MRIHRREGEEENSQFGTPSAVEMTVGPHVMLAQMPRLERLRFSRKVESAVLRQLPRLEHLTSLILESPGTPGDLQELCSTLSLSSLRMGQFLELDQEIAFDSREMLAPLGAAKMASLRELALPLPAEEARHLSRLAPLAALTALELEMMGNLVDLRDVASLTGLRSLQMNISNFDEDDGPAVASFSPLTALTGLTRLEVCEDENLIGEGLPSDASALSSLEALQVLRLSSFEEAEVRARDPLPVDLRFLRSATALEELDLVFWGSFWSLPPAASDVMREAVAALTRLKQVKITLVGAGWETYHEPLHVFAAASSIESFEFIVEAAPTGFSSGHSSAEVCGCFNALAKVRSLTLRGWEKRGPMPCCLDLLAELPSTSLTRLSISVEAEPQELMQQMSRFPDLQELDLRASLVDSSFLVHLADLKCVTWLYAQFMKHAQEPEAGVPPISDEVARLKATVLERARLVGVTPLAVVEDFNIKDSDLCTYELW